MRRSTIRWWTAVAVLGITFPIGHAAGVAAQDRPAMGGEIRPPEGEPEEELGEGEGEEPREGEGTQTAAKRLRDPFRPFTLELRPKRITPPKTPLEQYEIGSLNLVAIIWSRDDPKAMVEDASGTGFTIGIGTPIGPHGGIVKKIDTDRVLVEEEYVDFYGEKKKTEIVIKIEKEGEKTAHQ
jgi:Tfp pilus assembly protein PilP